MITLNGDGAIEGLGAQSPGTGEALSVNQGGTGSNTLTANAVLIGNGTGPLQVVSPGPAGNLLSSDGSTWQSITKQEIINTLFPAATVGNESYVLTSNGTTWVPEPIPSELPNDVTNGNILMANGTSWESVPMPTELPSPAVVGNVLTANGTTWVSETPKIPQLPVVGGNGQVLTAVNGQWASRPLPSQLPSPLTAGNVLTANGTTWVSAPVPTELPAPGTAGNVLTSNGSAWVSAPYRPIVTGTISKVSIRDSDVTINMNSTVAIGDPFTVYFSEFAFIRLTGVSGRFDWDHESGKVNAKTELTFGVRIGGQDFFFGTYKDADTNTTVKVAQFVFTSLGNKNSGKYEYKGYGNSTGAMIDIAAEGISPGNQTVQVIAYANGVFANPLVLKGGSKQLKVKLEIVT